MKKGHSFHTTLPASQMFPSLETLCALFLWGFGGFITLLVIGGGFNFQDLSPTQSGWMLRNHMVGSPGNQPLS